MEKIDYAQCPNCYKVAHGESEVNSKFGMRNDRGRIIVQSWCKKCRNAKK